jgi:acetolactate synthase-1/2/3 large subunit
MNAAQLLVRCLENEGVEYVFGIPGEENIHIMDALAQSRIRFVTTRHEQGAAFMAESFHPWRVRDRTAQPAARR